MEVGALERNWILVPTVASGMIRSKSSGLMEMGRDASKGLSQQSIPKLQIWLGLISKWSHLQMNIVGIDLHL